MHLDPISRVIVIAFFINLGIFFIALFYIIKLDKIVHPKNDRRVGIQANMSITDGDCSKLSNSSTWAAFWYTLFTNITAIFPRLGILGTVISLMNSTGADDLSVNFSTALMTTAVGLICAMIFKVIDSFISSTLDRALDEADYLIHEHDEEKRRRDAAQAETGHRH